MARHINKQCVACAKLSSADAKRLHGKEGDGCWRDKRCPSKRSYYRNRQKLNEKRRTHYRQSVVADKPVAEGEVETVSLEVDGTSAPYANLYIWREKRKDAPVHAIAASVIVEGSKVLEVAPIHCAGYRKRQLERYIEGKVMPYLRARFGITHFSNEIRLEPIECPIKGCPLSDSFEGIADG
ncbi:MAG: hypothetical protein AAFU71_06365 [Cyanobacteria bacterium J06632_22]